MNTICKLSSNKQKTKSKQRHEAEKVYMERLRGLGHAVGEYMGDGQGEKEDLEEEEHCSEGAEVDTVPDSEPDEDHEDDNEDTSDDAHPLLFLYDCETSGLSIYNEHIVEVAAKVVGVPLSSVSSPKFES